MPRLARITVYPIKSFDGVDVMRASFRERGGLSNDRRFQLRDVAGALVNGKRCPALHAVRTTFAADAATVGVATAGAPATEFALQTSNDALMRKLAELLGIEVRMDEDDAGGFPDDNDSPGPTVVSTATLEAVADWFPTLSLDEVRRRFRANLEIADCPPFWEDRLFAADASPQAVNVVPFRLGDVTLYGVNPCARCPVPTRDSRTGEAFAKFAVEFQRRRRGSLPPWAPPTAFDHYYKLCVNTRPSATAAGRSIAVGDEVTLDADL